MSSGWALPAALVLVLTGCSDPPRVDDPTPPEPSPAEEPAPAEAPTADPPEPVPDEALARPVSPEALREILTAPSDRPRVYNFWATWCGPCIAELPVIRQFARDRPEVEVVLVNVDIPRVRNSHVVPFLRRFDFDTLPSLHLDHPDPGTALHRVVDGWPDAIPVTLVVREDGSVARRFDRAIRRSDLDEAVAEATR